MKYREYTKLDLAGLAREVLSDWNEKDVFQKSLENREKGKKFTFYEGPPSANGTPGIHHVMGRAIKDIFCRYKTLAGYKVERKGGWDTHGLPVELQVEKELGLRKEDIGKKISIEEYNAKCREAVMKYKDQWDSLTKMMGYWVDLKDPYVTFEPNYIESLWWLLKELYSKKLLYKGYTIQPYSPAAGTGLSSHELNQPGTYKVLKDTTVTAQFKIEGTENDFFLAWTTTPWTLAANSALAVGNNITYVKVSTFNPYTFKPVNVILAKERLAAYFDEKSKGLELNEYTPGAKSIPFQVIGEFKGKELTGMSYEQLLPYVPLPKPAFTVVAADFVTTEDGTGIVHLSKTFGADDYRACMQHDIPGVFVKDEEGNEMPIVDKQGRYVQEITDFAGMYVKNEYYAEGEAPDKSLDVQIAIKLKEENKAFHVAKYEHSYPHCWRTDKPVLYYPLESWFIKTTAFKDRLVELNDTINWKPASTGKGRFGNWLENLVDWNLSRTRFWGTPLPIWISEDGTEEECIGSFDELRGRVEEAVKAGVMKNTLPADFDPHRPFVDEIVLVGSSGKTLHRVPDLIDVWFDSGAMPYAQWHYPFENKEIFEESYPADFIAEGVDQTRGWFFTLHAIAGLVFDKVAFKNVIANGLVLDKDGNKMSKRLNNAIDPYKTIDTYGPDPTRWYMIVNANPWDNLKFNLDGVEEVKRRFFGTLHNTYSFFALYANLDGFNYKEDPVPHHFRTESDQWILSKLNSLIGKTREYYEDYEPTKVARAIQDFVIDDLSNWYVRLNRKRFWKGEYSQDKVSAYQTLYDCLKTVVCLASPIAPFYMDRIYLDLVNVTGKGNSTSVHLEDYPVERKDLINKVLEEKMSLAQVISSLIHSIRKKHKIKVRQPLSKILLPRFSDQFVDYINAVGEIIKNEVNVKEIEFVDDNSGILVKNPKPNFRSLGQKYGSLTKDIATHVSNLSSMEILDFEEKGFLEFNLGSNMIHLESEDIEITYQDIPGWSVASEGKVTVALDITVTPDLQQEGLARDFVNRVQNLRKNMGLDVQDRIEITIKRNSDLINQAMEVHRDYICSETQANSLHLKEDVPNPEILDIDEHQLLVNVKSI